MQQRQLRLGDILDDYCPRERRLANHTVIAMVGDDVRLTRCTTCDTEHAYKGGKAPRLRKKKTSVEAAYGEVLKSVTHDASAPAAVGRSGEADESDNDAEAQSAADDSGDVQTPPGAPEIVRLHRPLIRAQLPREERDDVPRAIPEFTIRQANKPQDRFQNSRPGRFAQGGGGSNHQGNSRGPGGPHGARQGGRPQGQGSQMRPGGGRHQGQNPGGKKRSR
ncbi:MAG: hypothetical protein EXQ55_08930 [Acidobacteria bacterium]|nr:hypothetical protein [Acidobacteriota bacterium]